MFKKLSIFFLFLFFIFPQFNKTYAQTPGTYRCNWFADACNLNDIDVNAHTCEPGEYNGQNCADFTIQGEAVCNTKSFSCTPPEPTDEPPPSADTSESGYYVCVWDAENEQCNTYSPLTWANCNTGYQIGNECGSLSNTDCQSTHLPCEVNYDCGLSGQQCCAGSTCKEGNPTLINNDKTCICTTTDFITNLIHCENDNTINTAIGCIPYTNINNFVVFFTTWGIGIAGGVGFLLLCYAAFLYMTAHGDEEKIAQARQIASAVISGIIFLLLGIFILRFIGHTLINYNVFS
jgi:hypothetical protein